MDAEIDGENGLPLEGGQGVNMAGEPQGAMEQTSGTMGMAASASPAAAMAMPTSELSSLERGLLAIPVVAGAALGLLILIFSGGFVIFAGYAGDDHYIYRLLGAATLGYSVALAFVIREGNWAPARIVVIATLAFNVVALLACALEIVKGRATAWTYIITLASIAFVAITAWLLYTHQGTAKAQPDVAQWVVWLIVIATASAGIFGLLPIIIPSRLAEFFDYHGTDLFLYRLAGASTLGYAVMGVYELMSRNWNEMRLPSVMALVFNAVGFVSSVWSLTRSEDPKLLPIIVAVASLGVTIGTALAIQRSGK